MSDYLPTTPLFRALQPTRVGPGSRRTRYAAPILSWCLPARTVMPAADPVYVRSDAIRRGYGFVEFDGSWA